MREVVLDTETTGLDPKAGHRVIEIGCLELVGGVATGRKFHEFVNPERDIPEDAVAVHGIRAEMLADKPLFGAVAEALLEFLGDDRLVIHNAAFDLGFLNAELARLDRPPIPPERAVDTVEMARRKFPGAPANLDALCKRFGVDTSARTTHGALLDAELLSAVYLELRGGRQPGLSLTPEDAGGEVRARKIDRPARPPRPHAASDAERAAHAAFLEKLKDPIWQR